MKNVNKRHILYDNCNQCRLYWGNYNLQMTLNTKSNNLYCECCYNQAKTKYSVNDRSHDSDNYNLIISLSLTGADTGRYIVTPRPLTGGESVQTLQLRAQLAEKEQTKIRIIYQILHRFNIVNIMVNNKAHFMIGRPKSQTINKLKY